MGEKKKSSEGKEKAMSVRLEQYGILVVSQRSEKPHKQPHTQTQGYFLPPASSHLYGVSVVLAAALTITHGHKLKYTRERERERKHSLIPR